MHSIKRKGERGFTWEKEGRPERRKEAADRQPAVSHCLSPGVWCALYSGHYAARYGRKAAWWLTRLKWRYHSTDRNFKGSHWTECKQE